MNWSRDNSVRLSQACVILFALMLLALDVGCWWAARWFTGLRQMPGSSAVLMCVTLYLCSVFGWILLARLWALLRNIQLAQVFTPENVRILRVVSWCCVGAGVVCLVSAAYYLPFGLVGIAALFMALIVRIVKNVFQQAIAMKDDLDLTI